MTALWIILAIALVLTLLNLLPVGVDAAYAEGVFSLAARIGPARLHLLPKASDAKPGISLMALQMPTPKPVRIPLISASE